MTERTGRCLCGAVSFKLSTEPVATIATQARTHCRLTKRSTDMKITVETVIQAPVAKVWSAYTTPEDIMQWNAASDDWHTTKSTVDLREGAANFIAMSRPALTC